MIMEDPFCSIGHFAININNNDNTYADSKPFPVNWISNWSNSPIKGAGVHSSFRLCKIYYGSEHVWLTTINQINI